MSCQIGSMAMDGWMDGHSFHLFLPMIGLNESQNERESPRNCRQEESIHPSNQFNHGLKEESIHSQTIPFFYSFIDTHL